MTVLERIQQRAKRAPQHLIFPEGEDPRIVKAAHTLAREGMAVPILVGQSFTKGDRSFDADSVVAGKLGRLQSSGLSIRKAEKLQEGAGKLSEGPPTESRVTD